VKQNPVRWLTVCAGVAAGSCLVAPALGQFSQGPDVIVGEIPNISNYGNVGSIYAYAIGTTSCNKGNENLLWIAGTNEHPVISQNVYRFHNGRFEHIGQAWLKHGFTALTGNACNLGCNGQGGSVLGVGCSDPYSSGLNGSQGGLGPKSEVNASTGFFPFPFTTRNQTGNAIYKRLQVHADDINATLFPGARYFVSSQYIAADDAAAGNDLNNSAYREVQFASNGNMSFVPGSTTQRERAVIEAWAAVDPTITLSTIDIPGDGRFWVGSKATQLGPNLWEYEYAVLNYNSHRSAQAFRVPLTGSPSIAGTGFSDVRYHSGGGIVDNYDQSPWTVNIGSGEVSWATQTFAQNELANALRWDTTYNFRFQANAAPQTGSITLDLFRPGSPNSVPLTAVTPGGASGGLINDDCANALPITDSAFFNTTDATTDGPDEPGSCNFFGNSHINKDVWFVWTAPCNGTAVFSTDNPATDFDTKMGIYVGGCPASGGTIVACNDDIGGGNLRSRIELGVLEGQTYHIRIGGYTNSSGVTASGNGILTVTAPNCGGQDPDPPTGVPNDNCANAIALGDGIPYSGTIVGATSEGHRGPCGSGATANRPDAWFRYTPAVSGSVSISTCNMAGFDTVLDVRLSCSDTASSSTVACLDDSSGCGLTQNLIMNMTAGQTYLIRIFGFSGATGTYTILVTGGGGVEDPVDPVGPTNDDCADRFGISIGSYPFTTTDANTDGVPAPCAFNAGADVWFNFSSTINGTATITTAGSQFDTVLEVFSGNGCTDFDARRIACDDDGGPGLTSEVVIPVTDLSFFTIRVSGYNGASGDGILTITTQTTPVEPCPCDRDGDGVQTIADYFAYLTEFFDQLGGPGSADLDGDGVVSVTDYFEFLNCLVAIGANTPCP
jgi:hypothetical protein